MAYRDERHALEVRRDELQEELSDVESRLARLSARPAPLDDVRIASPCHMSWDAMPGDEAVRFCHACEKNVYDLSAMTRAEAERLLHEREGRICVRLYRRADGTVITSDCEVGARARGTRRTALGAALGAGAAAVTCTAALLVQVGRGPRPVNARAAGTEAAEQVRMHVGGLAGAYVMGALEPRASPEEVEGLHSSGDRAAPPPIRPGVPLVAPIGRPKR
jgi:hypothetical protein